ncbi:unnamed protein product, partial [Meganyctiphanes norvegica]
MDSIKKCCVCFEGYNEEHHRPLVLPCGYTLCKACVNSVAVIRCPICRKNHTIKREELSTNYVVIELLRASGNNYQSDEQSSTESSKYKDQDSSPEKNSHKNEQKEASLVNTSGISSKKIILGVVVGGGLTLLAAPVV